MNAADLSTLADLLRRSRDAVQQLMHLAEFGGDPTMLRAQLEALDGRIDRATFDVQQREAMSWGRGDRRRRRPAPPRIQRPTEPTPPQGLHVERFTIQGTRAAEQGSAAPLTGGWNQARHGLPRRRRRQT